MVLTLVDPDEVGEQVQHLPDAGLDGLIFHLPNPHDLDAVALAGETVSSAAASRARSPARRAAQWARGCLSRFAGTATMEEGLR